MYRVKAAKIISQNPALRWPHLYNPHFEYEYMKIIYVNFGWKMSQLSTELPSYMDTIDSSSIWYRKVMGSNLVQA